MQRGRRPGVTFAFASLCGGLALAVACGGGGGGGGPASAPTSWKDTFGNDNVIPALGENQVKTLAFAGNPRRVFSLSYSSTDPDLLLVVEQVVMDAGGGFGTTAFQVHAGRISTGKLDPYCGTVAAFQPAIVEYGAALFDLEGQKLVAYALDERMLGWVRYECDGNTLGSRDLPPYFNGNDPSPFSIPVADGFWYVERTGVTPTAPEIVHVRYDGAADLFPAPAYDNFAVERRGGGFYFLKGTEITKFDIKTGVTAVVATGVGPGTVTVALEQGLFVSMTNGGGQFVTFSQGTTPFAGGAAGGGASRPFYETGGMGVVIGGHRHDVATGMAMQVGFTNVPAATPAPTPAFTHSGHVYALTGDFHDIGVSVKPTATNMAAFDLADPDFKLAPYATLIDVALSPLRLASFADGTCLVSTPGAGGGGLQAPRTTGVVPVVQFGRTLSITTCGSSTGKVLIAGAAEPAIWSSLIDVTERPLFGAMHTHYRASPCEACVDNVLETADSEVLESWWTANADGTVVPLVKLANIVYFRPHSLQNLVVRHGDRLVVVAGD